MTQDQQISMVVFGALVAVSSLAWPVTSLVLVARFWRASRLERVPGRVVSHQPRVVWMSSPSGSHTRTPLLAPVVEFVASDGVARAVAAQVSSNVALPIGTSLVVAYPPGRPEEAIVDSALARYFAPSLVWVVLSLLVPLFAFIGLNAIQR